MTARVKTVSKFAPTLQYDAHKSAFTERSASYAMLPITNRTLTQAALTRKDCLCWQVTHGEIGMRTCLWQASPVQKARLQA
jgi:hypothetical protein